MNMILSLKNYGYTRKIVFCFYYDSDKQFGVSSYVTVQFTREWDEVKPG